MASAPAHAVRTAPEATKRLRTILPGPETLGTDGELMEAGQTRARQLLMWRRSDVSGGLFIDVTYPVRFTSIGGSDPFPLTRLPPRKRTEPGPYIFNAAGVPCLRSWVSTGSIPRIPRSERVGGGAAIVQVREGETERDRRRPDWSGGDEGDRYTQRAATRPARTLGAPRPGRDRPRPGSEPGLRVRTLR